MKLNLSKNKKFLLSLLVLAITYCNNINATVCKWNGCVPMYKKVQMYKKVLMYKNWFSWYKFNKNHNNDNYINKYSEQNLQDIFKECDYWEGQWPLNCPMHLVDNNDIVEWTDEYLKKMNQELAQRGLKEWQCEVPGKVDDYGPFKEVINFSSANGSPDLLACNKVYKLHPFLPAFILIIAENGNKITFLNTFTGQTYYTEDGDKTFGEFPNKQALDKLLNLIKIDERQYRMIEFYPPSQFFSPYIFDRLLGYFKSSPQINEELYQELLLKLMRMLSPSYQNENIEQIQKVENGKVVWLVLNDYDMSPNLPPRLPRTI